MTTISNSSPLHSSHRRSRSHSSTSSSSPTPRHSDLRRPAPKRTHPSQLTRHDCFGSPPSSASRDLSTQSPAKWDVDMWRRGKRARRDLSCPIVLSEVQPCAVLIPSSPVLGPPSPDAAMTSSEPSTPHFPSTSEAFQFFPSKSSSKEPFSFSSRSRSPTSDLHQLHSEAFTDLRRTVAENGEGFIQRMREWEETRSKSGPSGSTERPTCKAPRNRGRKRPSPTSVSHHSMECDDSDHGDVEILSSRTSNSDDNLNGSPTKKRAVSLGRMELLVADTPQAPPLANTYTRSSSPFEISSVSTSDDDDDGVELDHTDEQLRYHPARTKPSTPPLSFTFSNSASSSLSSLPLSATSQSQTLSHAFPKLSWQNPNSAAYTPSTASRSERAVAALSLALANGAGSVSDYEALRVAQGHIAMEDRQAGELWH